MSSTSPFGIHGDEKVAIFIDGAGVYSAAAALGFAVDFGALLAQFEGLCRFTSARYYISVSQDTEYNSLQPLIDWTSFNGYCVTRKTPKEYIGADGKKRLKGNVAVEMTIDMIRAAERCDHLVLFSGDGDFTAAVQEAQRRGARVTAVSTIASSPAIASDELRRAVDRFVDLNSLKGVLALPPKPSRQILTRAVA
ncbi:LabA-like NYN domain-containing protein [Methylobacterium sp. Leaf85]|uniref:LabA-like NYN domain-containing protein n=1 Tax=Methylobacterium sp. Leaf85 TaxID=1736241 RepID=UPI0006F1CEAA|nr:NYN domain-containing protein [Methylobacterium sp. Leaf85]KQO43052.1 hypothetical protein ASF08_10780 [Methylobacterium sp. Leaf85]